MAATAQSAIAVIGIDIGKNSFHVVGLDGRGVIVFPKGIRNGKTIDSKRVAWLPGHVSSRRPMSELGQTRPGAMSAQCPGYPR